MYLILDDMLLHIPQPRSFGNDNGQCIERTSIQWSLVAGLSLITALEICFMSYLSHWHAETGQSIALSASDDHTPIYLLANPCRKEKCHRGIPHCHSLYSTIFSTMRDKYSRLLRIPVTTYKYPVPWMPMDAYLSPHCDDTAVTCQVGCFKGNLFRRTFNNALEKTIRLK